MPTFPFKNPGQHTSCAKLLRKQSPETERRLWKALSALRHETGLHFRRQHPLSPYFADFACVKAKLIIELDGASHDMRQAYDEKRDAELTERGWKILRFSNEHVFRNCDGVVRMIIETAQQRLLQTHPRPLP